MCSFGPKKSYADYTGLQPICSGNEIGQSQMILGRWTRISQWICWWTLGFEIWSPLARKVFFACCGEKISSFFVVYYFVRVAIAMLIYFRYPENYICRHPACSCTGNSRVPLRSWNIFLIFMEWCRFTCTVRTLWQNKLAGAFIAIVGCIMEFNAWLHNQFMLGSNAPFLQPRSVNI